MVVCCVTEPSVISMQSIFGVHDWLDSNKIWKIFECYAFANMELWKTWEKLQKQLLGAIPPINTKEIFSTKACF